jgi:hypothetical protein
MRRALQLVGVGDADGRAALDDQVMLLGHLDHGDPGGVRVSGASNDDGVLRIDADADGLSPALLFEATLCHGSDVLVEVLGWMDREYPPASRSIVAGGWARMRSVRRSRAGILPAARFSERDEDTAVGAALVAAYAADPTADDLTSYLAAAAPAVPHPATSRPAVPRPAVPRPAGDAPTTAGPVPASPHPTPEGSSR